MKKFSLSVFILFAFGFQSLWAQKPYYLVSFKDKEGSNFSINNAQQFLSPRAIERRNKQNIPITSHDLPVSQKYINELKNLGIEVAYTSKWMNAALISGNSSQIDQVKVLPFVDRFLFEGNVKNTARNISSLENLSLEDVPAYANQLEMLGVLAMHEDGYTGKGVLIGILDSGFLNANSLNVFRKVFSDSRVLDSWDFVNGERNVFNDHSHGTNVWSCIAGDLDGQLLGTAPDASFALYTTEDVFSETAREELNWLFAAERADSLGVDVINTSLGYTTFDSRVQNYTYDDLNGNKAIITQAADWAASKGIVVVASAGNYGNKSWRYIGAPADADSILSVGAVDAEGQYASFSSIGPRTDGLIKPNVAAKGLFTTVATTSNGIGISNGTSFSSPLIAGMVAGFVQAFPELSAMEIKDLVEKSSSQFNAPDEKLGYGIPNYLVAKDLMNLNRLKEIVEEDWQIFPNPSLEDIRIFVEKEELEGPYTLEIVDLQGKSLFSKVFAERLFRIEKKDLQLTPATYVIKLEHSNGILSKKVVLL